MLPHYLFNVADLNPSHTLITQTLSPGYFHLPTATIYPKTSREGLHWKLDSLGVSAKLLGRPLQAGVTKRTSNTWQNTAQEMRQPHETHLTKSTKHLSGTEGGRGSGETVNLKSALRFVSSEMHMGSVPRPGKTEG